MIVLRKIYPYTSFTLILNVTFILIKIFKNCARKFFLPQLPSPCTSLSSECTAFLSPRCLLGLKTPPRTSSMQHHACAAHYSAALHRTTEVIAIPVAAASVAVAALLEPTIMTMMNIATIMASWAPGTRLNPCLAVR